MTNKLLSLPRTRPLHYYEVLATPLYTVQLIPNHHCAGSVGVIIHHLDTKEIIGYTGDFRIWDMSTTAVHLFLDHFSKCHTLHYDDSFRDHTIASSKPIPSLVETRVILQKTIRSATSPVYIYINRTGIEILFKGWMHELTVTFHESLSPAMKHVLPILYPSTTCRGPHPIVFCRDKNLATLVPECTSCYMKECGNFPICFHNTPKELTFFLDQVPKHIQLKPCGYQIAFHTQVKKTS